MRSFKPRTSLAVSQGLAIPDLPTVSDLFQWLDVSSRELAWLANHISSDVQLGPKASQHYVPRWIRKRSCGWRLLESPKPKLKSVQRQILARILRQVRPHPLAYGFRTGGNVIDFAKPHVNQQNCLKLDLADFFTSITIGRVYGLFQRIGYNHSVSHQLALLTTVHTSPDTLAQVDPHARDRSSALTTLYTKRHLPQGAPSSPAIANLCAWRLDARLSGLARNLGGVHYSRYADDILLSGDHHLARQAKRIQISAGAIALEEGFQINFRKTKLMRSSQRQSACGMVLNEKLNVDRRQFDLLKATLFNCVRHGARSQNRDGHAHFKQHLAGRIGWVEQVNAQRGLKLRLLFDQIDFET